MSESSWKEITCFGATYREEMTVDHPYRFRHQAIDPREGNTKEWRDGPSPDGSGNRMIKYGLKGSLAAAYANYAPTLNNPKK